METSIADAFQDLAKQVTDDIMEGYEIEQEAAKIADLVSIDSIFGLANELSFPIESVYAEGGEDALVKLEVDDQGLFDLVHEDARQYAADRAAELVGKKWVDGELVDNPDAQWAITETTREGIRSLVENAYSEGASPAELAKQISSAYSFSKERAKLIAKTETTKASVAGSLQGWQRSGLVQGKSSLLSDDHDADDECDENADAGVIGIEESFPSGDDGPPYHPGCNCSVVAEMIEEGELEE